MRIEEDDEKNKIQQMQFGFDNEKFIALLTKRGTCLKNSKFDEALEIEQQINEYKNKHADKVCSPSQAIVLFEYETAKLVLLKKDWAKGFHFCGSRLGIKKACHPTDIIWENDS